MSLYVLDTCILLGYARGAPFAQHVEDQHAPTRPPNIGCVSAVSVGEIKCFPIRRKWGDEKIARLDGLLRTIPVIDINRAEILTRYAEIATFCEGKNPSKPLPDGISPRPMSDNDLWIAATASVINGVLITTDKAFRFLDSIFLKVIWVDPQQK